jgi:lysophospholipase L1-like esterase
MSHVILLGDSIFDNARYVPGGPPVTRQLKERLPHDWQVTLLALDGATAVDVVDQVRQLPDNATHLVVSAGGNDALEQSGVVRMKGGITELGLLSYLADVRAQFQQTYRNMLRSVLSRRLPTTVCTIYDSIPGMTREEQAGLCLFNDVILREAFRAGLPVIDLRLICTDRDDYAQSSPIEPSTVGGAKIARAIARVVATHDLQFEETRVFVT